MILKHSKKKLQLTDPGQRPLQYEDIFITEKNKKLSIRNLGEKFASIDSYFFDFLKGYNIPCAFLKKEDGRRLLFSDFTELPFKVKILNAADKRNAKIFSIKTGTPLELPVFEYHFGGTKDSVISESHIISFNLCSYEDLKLINRLCSKINVIIKSFFERRNEFLVELTCGFGKFESKIYLIDDFSPLGMKVLQNKPDGKYPVPYKLETAGQMKIYTDHLWKMTNGE